MFITFIPEADVSLPFFFFRSSNYFLQFLNQCPLSLQWKHSSLGEGPDLALVLEPWGSLETFSLPLPLPLGGVQRFLFLYHHHMIGTFLDAFFCGFKHAMQFRQRFLHTIHLKIHNGGLVARRERLENDVNRKIIMELRAKSVQSLNVTNHFDHMRTDRATFC